MAATDPKEVIDTRADVGLRAQPAPPTGQPERKNGRLTRNGMLHVIRSGGTFTWTTQNADGTSDVRTIAREQDVPSEAEIAQNTGDASGAERARAANEAEIERLRAENVALRNVQPRAAGPAPSAPAASPPPSAPKR